MISEKKNIYVRVNSNNKNRATKILKEQDFTMTEAITLYLKEIVKCNGIPFDIVLNSENKNNNM